MKDYITKYLYNDSYMRKYLSDTQYRGFYRETVIYIPVIPNHWGHFLLDCLCRFWFINDDKYKDYRIAFCGYNCSNNLGEGNYLELLHLMGIDDSRLIYIKEPCSFA